MLSLESPYVLEAAEDSDFCQAETEEDAGEEREAGCSDIGLLSVRLHLKFRESGEDKCEADQRYR